MDQPKNDPTKTSLSPSLTALLKLREWLGKNARHMQLKDIAREIGIPVSRLARAMDYEDDLRDFTLTIMGWLAMQERRRARAEGTPSAARSGPVHLPVKPDFTPHARIERAALPMAERAPLGEIQRSLVRARVNGPVFCAITEREITATQCLALQGQPDCFGCAAPSRFCGVCALRPVAFPEIDLCPRCLQEEAARENKAAEKGLAPANPLALVACHLAGRDIPETICRAMQGETCGRCAAPARLCVKCKARGVYYPDYGLCLHCTVPEYWGKNPLPEFAPLDAEEQNLLLRLREPSSARPVPSAKPPISVTAPAPIAPTIPNISPSPERGAASAPKPTYTVETILEQYTIFSRAQRRSEATTREYCRVIRIFLNFLTSRLRGTLLGEEELCTFTEQNLESITPKLLAEFIAQPQSGGHQTSQLSLHSMRHHRGILRSLYTFLVGKGLVSTNLANALALPGEDVLEKTSAPKPKPPVRMAADEKSDGGQVIPLFPRAQTSAPQRVSGPTIPKSPKAPETRLPIPASVARVAASQQETPIQYCETVCLAFLTGQTQATLGLFRRDLGMKKSVALEFARYLGQLGILGRARKQGPRTIYPVLTPSGRELVAKLARVSAPVKKKNDRELSRSRGEPA